MTRQSLLLIQFFSPTRTNPNQIRQVDGSAWAELQTSTCVFYLYGLKNLDLITKGSDEIGNSPTTAPTTGHIEALITEQPADGTSTFSQVLDVDSGGVNNGSFRIIFPASSLSNSGQRVRFKLEGNVSVAERGVANNIAIGPRSGETAHCSEIPTEILVGGSSGATVERNGTIWTDWVDYDFDSTKDHLFILDGTSNASQDTWRGKSSGGAGYYSNKTGSASYNTAAIPGTINFVADVYLAITEIEVETQQTINTDFIGEMSRDGGTTFSPAVLARQETNVAGTTKTIYTGDVDFTGDPVGTNMVARFRTINNDKFTIKAISPNWNS